MDKMTVTLFLIWVFLAIANFVAAFFVPVVLVKVLGIIFGIENSLIILAWTISTIQAKRELRKHQKGSETEGMS